MEATTEVQTISLTGADNADTFELRRCRCDHGRMIHSRHIGAECLACGCPRFRRRRFTKHTMKVAAFYATVIPASWAPIVAAIWLIVR